VLSKDEIDREMIKRGRGYAAVWVGARRAASGIRLKCPRRPWCEALVMVDSTLIASSADWTVRKCGDRCRPELIWPTLAARVPVLGPWRFGANGWQGFSNFGVEYGFGEGVWPVVGDVDVGITWTCEGV